MLPSLLGFLAAGLPAFFIDMYGIAAEKVRTSIITQAKRNISEIE
jgi:hypothetical protein